jgi:hypothetical protein
VAGGHKTRILEVEAAVLVLLKEQVKALVAASKLSGAPASSFVSKASRTADQLFLLVYFARLTD